MKTLRQIQDNNRRKINCVIHGTGDYNEGLEKKLDLSIVLLALEGRHFGLDTCEEEPGNLWIYNSGNYSDWISWDLTKATLEEQSEETQRTIYELLHN